MTMYPLLFNYEQVLLGSLQYMMYGNVKTFTQKKERIKGRQKASGICWFPLILWYFNTFFAQAIICRYQSLKQQNNSLYYQLSDHSLLRKHLYNRPLPLLPFLHLSLTRSRHIWVSHLLHLIPHRHACPVDQVLFFNASNLWLRRSAIYRVFIKQKNSRNFATSPSLALGCFWL